MQFEQSADRNGIPPRTWYGLVGACVGYVVGIRNPDGVAHRVQQRVCILGQMNTRVLTLATVAAITILPSKGPPTPPYGLPTIYLPQDPRRTQR